MTTAFINGRILTMDESIPDAAVVVVHEEEIVAVGEEALLNAYPDAERYDLGGKLLIPGFIDAHCHLSIATPSSSSRSLAVSGRSTWGWSLSMLAVPASSTSVTATVTSRAPPPASMVTRYSFLAARDAPSSSECGSS